MRLARALHALVAALLVAATLVAATHLRRALDRPYDVEVVPPASAVRWISLGHTLLAANFYWLRTVQYIGEPRAEFRGWEKLYPLVQLVTDLDPGHGYAYQVAGVVLATGGRVAESNAILEKGTANVPNRYILPYLRAFNAFYYQGDWALAGKWAEIAARAPGAPDHVKRNVLAYYVKGGRAETAVAFLENVLAETNDPESRKKVEAELQQARFELAAERLDAAVAGYRARRGATPPSLSALVAAGLIDRLPPEPYGGAWLLGKDGRVRSTVHEFRFAPPSSAQELYVPELGRPAEPKVSK
jgi:tetratricopeptide (TPR) repeat protein